MFLTVLNIMEVIFFVGGGVGLIHFINKEDNENLSHTVLSFLPEDAEKDKIKERINKIVKETKSRTEALDQIIKERIL